MILLHKHPLIHIGTQTNFIEGYVAAGITLPIALNYVINGRFFRVAFLRRLRVVFPLSVTASSLAPYMFAFNDHSMAERVPDKTNRTLKVWLFIFGSIGTVIVSTLVLFIAFVVDIFFKTLILFRGLEFNIDLNVIILDRIEYTAELFADILHLPYFLVLLEPFLKLVEVLSDFHIDLSAINVTCAGALAPFQLLVSLTILGVGITIVESDIQILKQVTSYRIMREAFSMATKTPYKSWYLRNRGKMVSTDTVSIFQMVLVQSRILFARLINEVDLFQSILLYVFSAIDVTPFIKYGIHPSTPACNEVDGFIDWDWYIALFSSSTFWILFIPAVYEVSKILLPGIPHGIQIYDQQEYQRILEKDSREISDRHWWDINRRLTLFSYLNLDLWWAQTSQWEFQFLQSVTPYFRGHNTWNCVSVDQEQEELRAWLAEDEEVSDPEAEVEAEAAGVQQKESTKGSSDAGVDAKASSTSADEIKGHKHEVENRGEGVYRVILDEKRGRIYVLQCDRIVVDEKVWSPVLQSTTESKYVLIVLDRRTSHVLKCKVLAVPEDGGSSAEEIAQSLQQSDETNLVIFIMIGEQALRNRIRGDLPAAIVRCGASSFFFSSLADKARKRIQDVEVKKAAPFTSYVLIGVPGCGE